MNACHEMMSGETLNEKSTQFPHFNAIIYGDKLLCAKLSKRLSCAIKHLPIRITFNFEYNTQKALEVGVTKDPTLLLEGELFIEGLEQTEDIVQKFETLFQKRR